MTSYCWKCGASPAPQLPELEYPSAVAHLLVSNVPPLDSQAASIREVVRDGRAQVNILNNQISDLQAVVARLVDRRNRIEEHIRQHASILSPVRRLPPEILCEIFAFTLPYTAHVGGHGKDVEKSPWYLGHVSRDWRTIAIAYGSLWSSVEVHFVRGCLQTAEAIETQLVRSADIPLKISIQCDNRRSDAVTLPPDYFLGQCHRWETLRIVDQCDDREYNGLLPQLAIVKGRLSLLQELECTTSHYESIGSAAMDVFSLAPRLRKVTLTDSGYDQNSVPLLMPWGQITHYRGNFPVKYHLDLVESAVNLVECGLGFTDGDYAELRDRVVVLPRVRRLYVMQTDFLDHLTAPMLEELFLEHLGDTDQLLPFISRSSRHLTKLFLYGCHSPNAVVDALQHLPALKHLYVNLGHYSINREELYDFFAAMHIHRRPDDLCLRLKSLAIRVWYNRFSDSHFMDMLESRCRVGAPTRLSSLRIFFPVESKLDEDQKLRLEKIQEEGLIVHVSVVGRTAECMREECP